MESRDPAELRRYLAVTAELKYRGAHPNHKGENFERPYTLRWPNNVDHLVENHATFRAREDENLAVVRAVSGEALNADCTSTDNLLSQLRSFQKKGENIGYMGDKRKRLVVELGYDAKNASHCVRLLRMCIEFLTTGEMTLTGQTPAMTRAARHQARRVVSRAGQRRTPTPVSTGPECSHFHATRRTGPGESRTGSREHDSEPLVRRKVTMPLMVWRISIHPLGLGEPERSERLFVLGCSKK